MAPPPSFPRERPPQPSWRRRYLLPALRIGLCLLLLLLLLRAPALRPLSTSLLRATPLLLTAGILTFLAMTALDAWRFQLAFRTYGLGYPEALRVHVIGLFFSNFSPGMTGGEVYRVAVLQRLQKGLLRPITRLALLRLVGLAAMLGICGLYLLFQSDRLTSMRPQLVQPIRLPPALLIAAGAFVAAILFLVLRRRSPGLARARGLAADAWLAVHELGARTAWALGVVSVLVTIAGTLSLFLLLRSVSPAATAADMVLVLTLLTVGSLLPLTPGALGVREGAVAAGLAIFQVAPSDAVAVAIFNRGCFWLVSLIGALLVLRRPGLTSR